MKKRFFAALLLLCMLFALGLPLSAGAEGAQDHVIDLADILTAEEETALAEKARAISEQYSCYLYILTVEDYNDYGSSPRNAAENYFITYGLGWGPDQDGALLMLSMAERDYWFLAHGNTANTALTDYAKKEYIAPRFLDNFRNNDWAGGFSDFFGGCKDALRVASQGEPLERWNNPLPRSLKELEPIELGIIVGLPLLIAAIVCLAIKGKLKTVRKGTEARAYVLPGSAVLHAREDVYTHTTTVRTRRDTDRGGGHSGGGGTSIGSGGFSGHGGKF